MNPGKTTESEDVIISSLKKEKVESIYVAPIQKYFQKEALRIYQLSKKYPNSGLVLKELSDYYDYLNKRKILKDTNLEVLIAIFTMISVQSPRTINWTAAIMSKILEREKDKADQVRLTKLIVKKFDKIPNSGFIDIWLQRISAPLGIKVDYKDDLTKFALNKFESSQLWNSGWLDDSIKNIMDAADISMLDFNLKNNQLSPVIEREEVELFKISYF